MAVSSRYRIRGPQVRGSSQTQPRLNAGLSLRVSSRTSLGASSTSIVPRARDTVGGSTARNGGLPRPKRKPALHAGGAPARAAGSDPI